MATVTIRLDDEMRDRVTVAAEDRGLSISNFIREALELQLRIEGSESLDTKNDVSLSSYQRKVLQLLHRVTLAARGDLDDSYYDAAGEVKMIRMLEGGFEGEYNHEFADISEPMTRAECELVWDILDMFRVIQGSVKELGENGWAQIGVKDAEANGNFVGFDLNDAQESRLLIYTRYLIKTDRWTEQTEIFSHENNRGNSYAPMLPTYRSMLLTYKPLWRKVIRGGKRHLTRQDIEMILLSAPGTEQLA